MSIRSPKTGSRSSRGRSVKIEVRCQASKRNAHIPTSEKQVESRSGTCSDSDVVVTFHHRCLCTRPWKIMCWNLDIWCICKYKNLWGPFAFYFRTISRLPALPLISSLQGSLVCMCCCGWSILVEVYQLGCCPMHQQFNIYIYVYIYIW